MMSITMLDNKSHVVSVAHWLALIGPSLAPQVACGMCPWAPKGVFVRRIFAVAECASLGCTRARLV
jgi:hypothetical protein